MKKKIKYLSLSLFAVLFAIVMFAITPLGEQAKRDSGLNCVADEVATTYSYSLSEDGKVLTVSGTGYIDPYAFTCDDENGCVTAIPGTVKKVIIEEGITGIGNSAFLDAKSVNEVVLPDSLNTIESLAFDGVNLKSLYIPKNVNKIERMAFSAVNALNSIVVDSENTVYDSRNNCNAIVETSSNTLIFGCKSTNIVDGIKNIGAYAFFGGKKVLFDEITLPVSIVSVDKTAFAGNTVKKIKYLGTADQCLQKGIINLVDDSFQCNKKIVCLGSTDTSVTETGVFKSGIKYSLNNDGKLTVTGSGKINDYAFSNDSRIKSVLINQGITEVSYKCFENDSEIVSVELPTTLNSIGGYAFYGCNKIESIKFNGGKCLISDENSIPKNIKIIGLCNSDIYEYAKNNNYTFESIGNHKFSVWETKTEATLLKDGTDERYCLCCGFTETRKVTVPNTTGDINPESIKLARAYVNNRFSYSKDGYILIKGEIYAKSLVIYSITNDGEKLSINTEGTPIALSKDKTGYVLKYEDWVKAGRNDIRTAMTVGHTECIVVLKFDNSILLQNIETKNVKKKEIDSIKKEIKLVSNSNAECVYLYSNPHFDLSGNSSCTGMEVDENVYKFTRNFHAKSIYINGELYKITIIFFDFVPSDYISSVIYENKYDETNITLEKDGEEEYILVKSSNTSIVGVHESRYSAAYYKDAEYDLIKNEYISREKTSARFYGYVFRRTGNITSASTTFKIKFKDGMELSYKIVFEISSPYDIKNIKTVNVQSSELNSEEKKIIYYSKSDTYICLNDMYNDISVCSIPDYVKYGNIEYEKDSGYYIYNTVSGVSKFNIKDFNGEEYLVTVIFPTHGSVNSDGTVGSDIMNTKFIDVIRGSLTYKGNNQLTLTVSTGKSAVTINKLTKSSETIEILTSSPYITDNGTGYIISNKMNGQHIQMAVSGITYDVLVRDSVFLNTKSVDVLRGILAYDGDQLTLTISAGKSAATINKVAKTSEPIEIKTSSNVTDNGTGYVISSKLDGQHIQMTVSGIPYDVLVEKR